MFIQVSRRLIVNTDHIANIEVWPAEEEGEPTVVILFHPDPEAPQIRLEGVTAERFLAAIPVYRPTDED